MNENGQSENKFLFANPFMPTLTTRTSLKDIVPFKNVGTEKSDTGPDVYA